MGSIPTSAAKREGAEWPPAERVTCWNCGADHLSGLFCRACDAIQPFPEHADYFQILGIPRSLVVDTAALQKRYYELHRRLHPDLYQTGPQPARQASLRNTAAVNQAFRTLRDPVDRGLYWLTLHGEALGANNNRVPPELAALVFDVQETLEELRDARGSDRYAALRQQVAEVQTELQERQQELLQRLDANFVRWDAQAAERAALVNELKATLSSLAYVSTLIRDVEKELEQ